MNNTLPIIAGVDYPIQKIQDNLYQFAKDTWGVTDENFDCWGRTARNWKDDGFIPQPLKECSTKDLFYNDKLAGLSFFQVIDPVKVDGTQTTYNVALYLLLNLDRIKPDSRGIQRMDMEVVDELCKYLDGQYGFAFSEVHWDIDKILSEYSGEKKRSGVVSWNLHPKFCIRIDGTISGVQVDINQCDNGVIPNNNPISRLFPPDNIHVLDMVEGLDSDIQDFQVNILYPTLLARWGIPANQLDSWGRVQKNSRDGKYIPEVHIKNQNYKEVLINDKVAVTSFFQLRSDKVKNTNHEYGLSLYFFVDLTKVNAGAQRRDEETINDVLQLFFGTNYGLNAVKIWRDADKALSEFKPGKKALATWNLQNRLCFRIDLSSNKSIQYGCKKNAPVISDRIFQDEFQEQFQ